MSEVTRILMQIDSGDSGAAEHLLPLVYGELRKLAAARLAQEKPGQTLQATALVHEAYLRLVGPTGSAEAGVVSDAQGSSQPAIGAYFDSRGHFFAAAAEAMRRILIDAARRKQGEKHGGQHHRVELSDADLAVNFPLDDVLAIDDALTQLAQVDHATAELVKLHCFAGLTIEQAAQALGIPARTAYRHWAYARAWLFRSITGSDNR